MTEPNVALPAEPLEPQAIPEAPSLSEHRDAFPKPDRLGRVPDVTEPAEKPRHRAKSQIGSTEDVAAIAELTRRVRDAERDSGIERKTGESERVYQLRVRAELAERAKQPAVKEPPAAVPAPPAPVRPIAAPGAFTEAEPTLAQFKDAPDPYLAHARALAGYDRRKEAFEASTTAAKAETEAQAQERQTKFAGWVKDVQTQHLGRMTEMLKDPTAKATFDAHAALPDAEQIQFTPVMHVAIETSGQGPAFLLELLRHPDLADQLVFETNGQLAFDGHGNQNPLVALLQRRLQTRVQAASTGSVASPVMKTRAPRPPNPVRTVPQTPPEKVSAEPAGSLAEHRRRIGSR